MPRTRNEWIITGVLLTVLLGFVAWWFIGSDRQQAFIRDVQAEVARVNEGDYSEVRGWMSPEFIAQLERMGANPQQAVFLIRQRDKAQNARYAYRRLNLWDPEKEDFAEVVFVRIAGDNEQEFTLPFTYRNGRWWVTDHFRSHDEGLFPHLPGLQ